MWLINQEDLTKELHQQNLPGTTAEYPNWGRKMRWTIAELASVKESRDCAAMMRYWVESVRTPTFGRRSAVISSTELATHSVDLPLGHSMP